MARLVVDDSLHTTPNSVANNVLDDAEQRTRAKCNATEESALASTAKSQQIFTSVRSVGVQPVQFTELNERSETTHTHIQSVPQKAAKWRAGGTHRLTGGAGGVTGAVAGARIALRAALDVSVGGISYSAHEYLHLSVLAGASHKGVSDCLGVDASKSGSEAVGPCGRGGGLIPGNADLDLSLSVHVSHELDEGGGDNLRRGGSFQGGVRVAGAAAVVRLSVCMSVCLGGGRSPGGSL